MDNLQRMYNTLEVIIPLTKETMFHFSPSLDSSYLNIIYGDDLEYANEIFDLFLQSTTEEMHQLIACMQSNAHSDVYQIAHRIKPTFAMVGLTNASKILQSVEESAVEELNSYEDSIIEVKEILLNSLPLVKQEHTRIQQHLQRK